MRPEVISQKDRTRLRELAKIKLEYSHLPIMEERRKEWYRHAAFLPGRPMIHLEVGSFPQEVIAPRIQCEGGLARQLEWQLLDGFLNYELFDDDRVVNDYFSLNYETFFTLFGINITTEHATSTNGSNIGHHFNTVIDDLHDDFEKLGETQFGYCEDKSTTLENVAFLTELFGDILPIKLTMSNLTACPTQLLVHMMGMETMFYSMYDYPDEFKIVMNRVADDFTAYFDWLTKEQLLLPTVGNEWLGNGSFCYTSELPGEDEFAKRPFTTKDVWGFMDSQETVGVSPEMFEEFIFPCYDRIASQFGLLSYGCCEPVHSIWDNCLSRFEKLRKVSVSAWCDEEFMGERLRGRKTIFFRKPSPNFLGVGRYMDEEAVRENIKKTLHAAQGCQLEFAQRDVYTVYNDMQKAHRYIEIIRECIEEDWRP